MKHFLIAHGPPSIVRICYNSARMQTTSNTLKYFLLRFTLIITLVSILASCQLAPSPAQDNAPPAPKQDTPVLPETFQTELINPLDIPHTYIEPTCRSLRYKWSPFNSEPGTVVMIILFKNINRGTAELPDSITVVDFLILMNELEEQGFEAINTERLQAFLERNAPIPPRSVLLVQDGNQSADYFDKNFGEYFARLGWPVVNGWVSDPNVDETLRLENFNMEYENFVDHQARGVTPDTILSDDSAKTIIARELQGSLTGFADQFGKTPNLIVWPNGGFGIRPIEAARQLRFRLGITQNPRGPVMFNWVPLADDPDPERPTLAPEGRIVDPLMTLPAYSANEALLAIDTVRNIGKQAAEYAEASREAEIEYYNIVCADEFGPMPTP